MATKSPAKKPASKPKADKTPNPADSPRVGFPTTGKAQVAPGVPPATEFAEIGHFATVTGGEHEGVYGVLLEQISETEAILRPRDSGERLVVKISDTAPADSGRH